MGKQEQPLAVLKSGVGRWNDWVEENPGPANLAGADLSNADLSGALLGRAVLDGANLKGANLSQADLHGAFFVYAHLNGANLSGAMLGGADFSSADLTEANFSGASLRASIFVDAHLERADFAWADLSGANFEDARLEQTNLSHANLTGANFARANLTDANLIEANLSEATLIQTRLEGADFSDCRIYGISAWDPEGTPKSQSDLVITPYGEAVVTVDDLEVAQFMYQLLNNQRLRRVIDTVTSKAVLILGRFLDDERKAVLDALRDALRARGLTPILCDFDVPEDRDITETVSLLARMARFVVADLTDPRSIPQEIQAIAPDVAVPIQPVIVAGQEPWSMFRDLRRKYHWVLEPYEYKDQQHLLATLDDVITPAETKREELSSV